MLATAHLRNECSYLVVAGARHRASFAWCDNSTISTTKHQRLKEPSPG